MTSHKRSIPEPRSPWDYVPSGSVDSSPETSSTCRSGGLGVAKDTTCVQGLVRIRHLTTPLRSIHLPVESPRKVGAPESSLQLTRLHGWHSERWGRLSLCVARGSLTSSSATSKRRFRWRIRYLVSAGHQQMDTEPVNRPVSQLRLNDETPVFPTVLYLSLAHKAIGTNHTTSPGCRVTAPALRS